MLSAILLLWVVTLMTAMLWSLSGEEVVHDYWGDHRPPQTAELKASVWAALTARKAARKAARARKAEKRRGLRSRRKVRPCRHRTMREAALYRFRRQQRLGRMVSLWVTGLSAANAPGESAADRAARELVDTVGKHTNLGRLLASLGRRMGHLPMSTMTVLPGGDGEPKVIFKTSGRDNIGLSAFQKAFGLHPLGEQDALLIEANGASQDVIERLTKPMVVKGYRPVGTRMLLRCFNEDGTEAPGADYVRCISAMLGSFTDVRSYFTLGSAPALHQFSVPTGGLFTEREGAEKKKILWFAGKAKEIFSGLDGTEGGLPISEKAMETIYGNKKPAQPRLVLKLEDGTSVLFKGNHTVMSVRAFLKPDGGYEFKTRGHFDNTETGKAAWRQGFDFVFLEDDSPKGASKAQVKVASGVKELDVEGKLFGWIIAQANDKQGSSLVSYQVLALLAQSNGFPELAEKIERLVAKSVRRSVAFVERDLEALALDDKFCADMERLKKYLAAKAPSSARESRKNHLGFGAKMTTGYIHMSSLFNKGVIIVGDEFGLTPAQVKRDRRYGQPANEPTCGGKNPILDHQQVFVGKAVRLTTLNKLRALLKSGTELDNTYIETLQMLFSGKLSGDADSQRAQAIESLNWMIAHSPSLTRGSILMNCEDVADLAGDDDGDQLWFSFRCNDTYAVMAEVKKQAQGNTNYSIENNKKAQQPSVIGGRKFADILDVKGDELDQMVRFMMAPNKGQGPVGYLANLCTILITFFKKVDNGKGGLKFKNIWVERLQAVLNHLQQTGIDKQKRDYLSECLKRWTLADLRTAKAEGRGLVPGYDFPAHGVVNFNRDGFDPHDFTDADYKHRVGVVDGSREMIPHHQTGQLLPVLTDQDSQYNISALGSWLIWECVSLFVTGKPCDWEVEMHPEAKGGLTPMSFDLTNEFAVALGNVYRGEGNFDGDDVGALYKDGTKTNLFVSILQAYPDFEDKDRLKALCVEKPRELYAWKTQSKSQEFAVKAPPALELNHEIALKEKRSHKPDGDCPVIKVDVLISEILRLFAVSMNEASLANFTMQALEKFYLEAAMANDAKSTSEKMQAASERSGVESLRLLIEAFESWPTEYGQQRKLALGISDAINPRMAIANKDEKIALVAMIFAWYEQTRAAFWAFDMLDSVVSQMVEYASSEKQKMTRSAAWQSIFPGLELTDARSCSRGKSSRLRRDPGFLLRCEAVAESLPGAEAKTERFRARATWFVDEGLPCLVKAKERQAIVSSKRDILKSLSETVRDWHSYRADWSDAQVSVEILISTFLSGGALWLDPIKEKLQEYALTSRTSEEVKALKVELKTLKKSNDDADKARAQEIKGLLSKARRASKAKAMLDLIEYAGSKAVTAEKPGIIDKLCDPAHNPLAKEFALGLSDNSGPVMNVERAWRRAKESDRQYIEAWTEELGNWFTPKKRRGTDPNTGERRITPNRKLMANSRVEWTLSVSATGAFTRALLEGGVSFYKLTKLPLRERQTWRYFSAFVAETETLSDWQLTHGFGHLVSLAIPLSKQNERGFDGDLKYARVEHVKLLEKTLQDNGNIDLNSLSPADASWMREQLEGCRAEKARIEALRSNPLMASWGVGLLFPCTWGWAQRSYAGQLTAKKLNGRAANALITLGGEDFMPKPKTEQIGNIQVPLVTSQLKPNWDAINRYRPYVTRKNDYTSRVNAMNDALTVDDTFDMVPFELEGARCTYKQWLFEIQDIACKGGATCEGLTAAALWFQSHVGRLMVINPGHSMYNEEIAGKIRKKLLACPSFDARIHIEDLLKSQTWVAPKYNTLNEDGILSFFEVVITLTNV